MDLGLKWYFIAMGVMFLGFGAGMAVEKYEQGQCKVAAIQKGMSADDIAKLCK